MAGAQDQRLHEVIHVDPVGEAGVEGERVDEGEPTAVWVDEPAGGLTHGEVDELGDLIQHIRASFNLSVLLVEHHMSLVMSVSDKVVTINFGRKIAEGTPDEVRNDPEVLRAYLGRNAQAGVAGRAA